MTCRIAARHGVTMVLESSEPQRAVPGTSGKTVMAWAYRQEILAIGRGYCQVSDVYAIPVFSAKGNIRPWCLVQKDIVDFIAFARDRPGMRFEIAPIGRRNYDGRLVLAAFAGAPENCELPVGFKR